MLVYKVDQTIQSKASSEIKDMGAVLSEIAPTLRILRDLLKEHEASLSVPSINSYRQDLLNMIPEAIRLTHMIAVNSQRLSTVSEQAVKQLGTLDMNVRSALVSNSAQTPQATTQTQASTADNKGTTTSSPVIKLGTSKFGF